MSIKLTDFIVPEANLIPLLTFKRVHVAKFHVHHSVFLRNAGLDTVILFIKLELYCVARKKKSIPDWHLFITQMETKWTKWYAMTSHVIAYRLFELLFGTHPFHFNCFFEDFNCLFTQIRCLSSVLCKSLVLQGKCNIEIFLSPGWCWWCFSTINHRGSLVSSSVEYKHDLNGTQIYMSQCMRFPTMWHVPPAKPQISLRICAV